MIADESLPQVFSEFHECRAPAAWR